MHQVHLQGLNDPFTLLKALQLFREIPVNDRLEIVCENAEMLDELFRVLPAGSYQVEAGPERLGGPPGSIVVRKTASTSDRPLAGGCRCS